MSHPFHPIIYVRGFAGTQGEIEDTASDPYMGFNIGSAKCRQAWDGSMRKFFFESPLVRLIEEYGYRDVYSLAWTRSWMTTRQKRCRTARS
jgi:hypothetical protein